MIVEIVTCASRRSGSAGARMHTGTTTNARTLTTIIAYDEAAFAFSLCISQCLPARVSTAHHLSKTCRRQVRTFCRLEPKTLLRLPQDFSARD